jgi:fructan beta-fructosidase
VSAPRPPRARWSRGARLIGGAALAIVALAGIALLWIVRDGDSRSEPFAPSAVPAAPDPEPEPAPDDGTGAATPDDEAGAASPPPGTEPVAPFAPDEPTEDAHRPSYHFTSARNWLNDPNGPILLGDRYHLFYQYNPYGSLWGDIGWGHAVSDDLVHWEEQGLAIPADEEMMIFSGSTVFDADDTSGQCGDDGCLVAVFTGYRPGPETELSRQTQDLAFSRDAGATWERFEGNPVIDLDLTDFRDPNVFWHEPTQAWILSVALPLERRIAFYRSPNLIDWEAASSFGPLGADEGIWECPVLLELPVEGSAEQSRWLLKVDHNPGHITGGSGAQYFIGDFDGTTFVPEAEDSYPRWVDFGPDFYCAMPFSDATDDRGRRIWIAWMNNWDYATSTPTEPWRGAMTLPQTIALTTEDEQVRLVQRPLEALADLRREHRSYAAESMTELDEQLAADAVTGQALEIATRVELGDADEVGLRVRVGDDEATSIVYRAEPGAVTVDRTTSGHVDFHEAFPGTYTAPLEIEDGAIDLHVYVDRSSLEVFAGDGRVVLTQQIFPDPASVGVEAFAGGGTSGPVTLDVWRLEPADG